MKYAKSSIYSNKIFLQRPIKTNTFILKQDLDNFTFNDLLKWFIAKFKGPVDLLNHICNSLYLYNNLYREVEQIAECDLKRVLPLINPLEMLLKVSNIKLTSKIVRFYIQSRIYIGTKIKVYLVEIDIGNVWLLPVF